VPLSFQNFGFILVIFWTRIFSPRIFLARESCLKKSEDKYTLRSS